VEELDGKLIVETTKVKKLTTTYDESKAEFERVVNALQQSLDGQKKENRALQQTVAGLQSDVQAL
jgi:ABC-type transporter Mla subunit MlaD